MTQERVIQAVSGWRMLPVNLLLIFGGFAGTIGVITVADARHGDFASLLLLTIPAILLGPILSFGHFTLQPNEARVLTLFGDYRGTVTDSGFWWTNPFMTKTKLSLRVRNLETARLKV